MLQNIHIINLCNFRGTCVLCVEVQIKMGKKKIYEDLVVVKWPSVANFCFSRFDHDTIC